MLVSLANRNDVCSEYLFESLEAVNRTSKPAAAHYTLYAQDDLYCLALLFEISLCAPLHKACRAPFLPSNAVCSGRYALAFTAWRIPEPLEQKIRALPAAPLHPGRLAPARRAFPLPPSFP